MVAHGASQPGAQEEDRVWTSPPARMALSAPTGSPSGFVLTG